MQSQGRQQRVHAAMTWAQRLKRVFNIDIEVCGRCGGIARIAPAYDLLSTISYIPDSGAALTVSRTKRFDGFDEAELVNFAGRVGLAKVLVLDTARETVALFHQHWIVEKNNLPLFADVVSTIDKHLKTVPVA